MDLVAFLPWFEEINLASAWTMALITHSIPEWVNSKWEVTISLNSTISHQTSTQCFFYISIKISIAKHCWFFTLLKWVLTHYPFPMILLPTTTTTTTTAKKEKWVSPDFDGKKTGKSNFLMQNMLSHYSVKTATFFCWGNYNDYFSFTNKCFMKLRDWS